MKNYYSKRKMFLLLLLMLFPCALFSRTPEQSRAIVDSFFVYMQKGKPLVKSTKVYKDGKVLFNITPKESYNDFMALILWIPNEGLISGSILKYSNIEEYNKCSAAASDNEHFEYSEELYKSEISEWDVINRDSFDIPIIGGMIIHPTLRSDYIRNGVTITNSTYANVKSGDLIGTWKSDNERTTYQYKSDGTATVTTKERHHGFAPQQTTASWRGQYNKSHSKMTGGYSFDIQCDFVVKYKWSVTDGKITYTPISHYSTPIQVIPNKSCGGCDPAYAKLWAQQVLADYPYNPDVQEGKKIFIENINNKKPTAYSDKMIFYDGKMIELSNHQLLRKDKNYRPALYRCFTSGRPSLLDSFIDQCATSLEWKHREDRLRAREEEEKRYRAAQRLREQQKLVPQRISVIEAFMEELLRVSKDKSINFWGASRVLCADFETNYNSVYDKYITWPTFNITRSEIITIMVDNVARFLPIKMWNLLTVVEEGDIKFYVQMMKQEKKNKISYYKTEIIFGDDRKFEIDMSKSFVMQQEITEAEYSTSQ